MIIETRGISKKDFIEDFNILKRIEELNGKYSPTNFEEIELAELYHQYYVLNDDIRRYWKTY
jgi:hypothetical protein